MCIIIIINTILFLLTLLLPLVPLVNNNKVKWSLSHWIIHLFSFPKAKWIFFFTSTFNFNTNWKLINSTCFWFSICNIQDLKKLLNLLWTDVKYLSAECVIYQNTTIINNLPFCKLKTARLCCYKRIINVFLYLLAFSPWPLFLFIAIIIFFIQLKQNMVQGHKWAPINFPPAVKVSKSFN